MDELFNLAVTIIQGLPKTGAIQSTYDEKLEMYSLYKQATLGDCSGPRPSGLLDILNKAKWDSWRKLEGMSVVEAQKIYVRLLLGILKRYKDRKEARLFIKELEGNELVRSGVTNDWSSFVQSSSSVDESEEDEEEDSEEEGSDASQRVVLPDPSLPAPDIPEAFLPPRLAATKNPSVTSSDGRRSIYQYQHQPYNPRPTTNPRASSVAGSASNHPPSAYLGANYFPNRTVQSGPSTPTLQPQPQFTTPSAFPGSSGLSSYKQRLPDQQLQPPPPQQQLPYQHSSRSQHRQQQHQPRHLAEGDDSSRNDTSIAAALEKIQVSLQALHERLIALETSSQISMTRTQPVSSLIRLLFSPLFRRFSSSSLSASMPSAVGRRPISLKATLVASISELIKRTLVDLFFCGLVISIVIGFLGGRKGEGRRMAVRLFWQRVLSFGRRDDTRTRRIGVER